MPLREHGTKPRDKAAPAVKIAEQRPPLAAFLPHAEEIRVQGIGELAGSAAGIERVGGAIQKRALGQHEMLPRLVVARRARTRERQIFQVKRGEVALEIARLRRPAGKHTRGARFERLGEAAL